MEMATATATALWEAQLHHKRFPANSPLYGAKNGRDRAHLIGSEAETEIGTESETVTRTANVRVLLVGISLVEMAMTEIRTGTEVVKESARKMHP